MKRFDIITETDARSLDIGATVELSPERPRHTAGKGHAGRSPRHGHTGRIGGTGRCHPIWRPLRRSVA